MSYSYMPDLRDVEPNPLERGQHVGGEGEQHGVEGNLQQWTGFKWHYHDKRKEKGKIKNIQEQVWGCGTLLPGSAWAPVSGREYQESSVSPESLAPSPTTATRTAPTSALSSSEEIGRNPCLDTRMVTLSSDGIEEAYYLNTKWRILSLWKS